MIGNWLVTGDWQLHNNPYCDRLDDSNNSIRLLENVKHIKGIMDEAYAAGCRTLLHLGDLTEHKNARDVERRAAAYLFSYWLNLDAENRIIGCPGNHDGSIFSQSSSSFESLAMMAGTRMTVPHEIQSLSWGGTDITILPYMHRMPREELARQHAELVEHYKKPAVMAIHYGVADVIVGPNNSYMPGDLLGKSELFPEKYKVIFAGHIHKQQIVKVGGTDVVFPGSPSVHTFGERNDNKGYAIYDPNSGKYELKTVAPPRDWVEAVWPFPLGAGLDGELPWKAGDIVKVKGTYPRGEHTKEAIIKAIEDKILPEPFFLHTREFRPEVMTRALRSDEISEAPSISQAIQTLVNEKVREDDREAVIALIQSHLNESQRPVFSTEITPTIMGMTEFMSYKKLEFDFVEGVPTLIIGPNGLGKTNILEALLFLLTGKTSKNLELSSLLRRKAKKGEVFVILTGADPKDQMKITRTLTRTKKGVSQKLSVEAMTAMGEWEDWTDGSLKEVQANINASLGLSFESLKATNFLFQRDPDPFVKTEPLNRKKILGEILNQGFLKLALKVLDEQRREVNRKLIEAKGKLEGFEQAGLGADAEKELQNLITNNEKVVTGSKATLEAAQKQKTDSEKATEVAVAAMDKAQVDLNALPDTAGAVAVAKKALETAQTASKKRRDDLVEDFRKAKTALNTATEAAAVGSLDVLKSAEEALDEKLQALHPQVEEKDGHLAGFNTEIGGFQTELDRANKEIKDLSGNDLETCSKCGQKVDATHIKKELDDAQTAKIKAEKNLKVAKLSQEGVTTILTDLKLQVTNLSQQKNDKIEARINLEKAIKTKEEKATELKDLEAKGLRVKAETAEEDAKLGGEIKIAEEDHEAGEKVRQGLDTALVNTKEVHTKLKETQDTATTAWSDARTSNATAVTSLEGCQKNLTDYHEKVKLMEEATKDHAKLDVEHRHLLSACLVLDPKTGLPIYLLDAQIPYLEDRINHYMGKLGMPELLIQVSTQDGDKETLSILVDDGENAEGEELLDIRAYSGGQQGRIEMAIKQALCDLSEITRGTRLKMLCLDEPTDGLDDDGKQELIRMVDEQCADRYPVAIIISHDERMLSSFDYQLRISKNSDGSSSLSGTEFPQVKKEQVLVEA